MNKPTAVQATLVFTGVVLVCVLGIGPLLIVALGAIASFAATIIPILLIGWLISLLEPKGKNPDENRRIDEAAVLSVPKTSQCADQTTSTPLAGPPPRPRSTIHARNTQYY